jgi:hypothetical protein
MRFAECKSNVCCICIFQFIILYYCREMCSANLRAQHKMFVLLNATSSAESLFIVVSINNMPLP